MKPKVLVCRATFDEVIARLRQRYELDDSQADDRDPSAEELKRRMADKDAVLVFGGERIDGAIADACPRLKAVCSVAVGVNNLDLAALTGRGIAATNTAGTLDETTADMVWALMLAAARRVTESERWLRTGVWKGWANDQFLGQDIYRATLGIIGMGRIGRAVARRARGFEMRVLYHNRNRAAPEAERQLGAAYAGMEQLLRESDFVSLNLPYSRDSHHLIGAAELALMKPNAIIVNAARGGIIDDAALIEALRAGRIAGAGMDVFEGEPRLHPGFFGLDNVVLAPHIASATRATRMKMNLLALENLEAALSGRTPPNLLNPEVWPKRRR